MITWKVLFKPFCIKCFSTFGGVKYRMLFHFATNAFQPLVEWSIECSFTLQQMIFNLWWREILFTLQQMIFNLWWLEVSYALSLLHQMIFNLWWREVSYAFSLCNKWFSKRQSFESGDMLAKKIVLLFVFAKSFLRQGTFDCHMRAHTEENSF